MGNQGHSSDDGRTAVEYVWPVRLATCAKSTSDESALGYWPHSVPRPTPLKPGPNLSSGVVATLNTRLAAAICAITPSPVARWDLFKVTALQTGTTPHLSPLQLRAGPIGVGAIGDNGSHLIDPPVALNLAFPPASKTVSTPSRVLPQRHRDVLRNPRAVPCRQSIDVVRTRSSHQTRRTRRTKNLNKKAGAAHRQTRQAPPRHLRFKPRLCQVLHDPFGSPRKAPAHRKRTPRNELGRCRQGKVELLVPFEYAAVSPRSCSLGIVALRAGKRSTTTAQHARYNVCKPTTICAETIAKAGPSKIEGAT